MFVKILLILLLFPCLISTEPIELTDKTWKNMLHGEWMVEFYAPWCSACKHFKPIWNDFSKAMIIKNIKVAAINTDQYPGLSNRFRISALPTVYYVRNGVFRQFKGERSLNNLKNYIEYQDWQRTEPLSSYFGPTSILMSFVSSVFDLSILVKDTYTLLREQYGWPAWLVYTVLIIGVLAFGIVLGFSALQIIDYCAAISSKIFTKTIPKNLDKDDSQKLLKSKKQTITTDTSSTSEQTTDENQNDEELEFDQSDNSDEESNILDAPPATNEEEEQITTDQTVRQRRLEKEPI